MSCSDYNQGCEGGYPFLVAKFAEDKWVPTDCQDYTADEECDDSCFADSKNVYRALDYEYVGGYYGACSEADMMKAVKTSPNRSRAQCSSRLILLWWRNIFLFS